MGKLWQQLLKRLEIARFNKEKGWIGIKIYLIDGGISDVAFEEKIHKKK